MQNNETDKDTCEIKIKTVFCETFSTFTNEPFYGISHLHVANSIGHTRLALS